MRPKATLIFLYVFPSAGRRAHLPDKPFFFAKMPSEFYINVVARNSLCGSKNCNNCFDLKDAAKAWLRHDF